MSTKSYFTLMAIYLTIIITLSADPQQSSATDLSGQWRFAMDRTDVGVKEEWFNKDLTDHIQIPGILQSQGFGDDISIDTPWVAALPRDMRWYLKPEYKAYTVPGNHQGSVPLPATQALHRRRVVSARSRHPPIRPRHAQPSLA